jgi:multicomponent Na+:H+ antiporter subunit F
MIVQVLQSVAIALFGVAALLVLVRLSRGPGILDRMIATDVLLTTLVLATGTYCVLNRTTVGIPLMLVLAGTSALSAIAVSRYVSRRGPERSDDEEEHG